MLRILTITLLALFSNCNEPEPLPPPPVTPTLGITYLALGDSYTIGQSVAEADRFPNQLAARLEAEGIPVAETRIIAQTGWTTFNLLNALHAAQPEPAYDLVSLLIGVNNQFQERSIQEYESEFTTLLEEAVRLAGDRPERVFVVSIPDYAYTPFGQSTPAPATISQEIDDFNAVNRSITEDRGIAYFDITPISREGLDRPELVATDQLHPSGLMYQEWVALFFNDVLTLLKS